MDGVAIHEHLNTRSSQLLGRPKGTNAPRKVLADIKNVQQSKTVSFEAVKLNTDKLVKKNNKTTQVNRNIINTPGSNTFSNKNFKTSVRKSMNHVKGSVNTIKIYKDTNDVLPSRNPQIPLVKSKYDIPDCKEYMAPCTDKDFEIPLPGYLRKLQCFHPTYNIDLSKNKEIVSADEFIIKSTAEYMNIQNSFPCLKTLEEEIFFDYVKLPMFCNGNLLDDQDLLEKVESDESFSLDIIDKELNAAGLEVPDW